MTEPAIPPQPASFGYVLTDASGREFPSLATPTPHEASAVAPRTSVQVPSCCEAHGQVLPAGRQFSLTTAVAASAAGALVVGAVVVALLLSVAVVAASVAVAAVAITCCVLVMRSLVSGPHR